MDLEKNEQIYEAVQIKEINAEWNSVKTQQDYYEAPYILSKQLGHPEIVNAKKWKQMSECWMCDKWRYSIVFWHPLTGFQHQIQDGSIEQLFESMIFKSRSNFE